VDHRFRIRDVQPQPSVLDDVVGFGQVAEDPVGDPEQPRAAAEKGLDDQAGVAVFVRPAIAARAAAAALARDASQSQPSAPIQSPAR
jgi:hypothetical protein